MNKERKTLTHKFGDARCRLPPCRAEGCCWVGDKFLAITKRCFEVGSYVQRWEDAAGDYQTQPHLHPTCGYHNQMGLYLCVTLMLMLAISMSTNSLMVKESRRSTSIAKNRHCVKLPFI